MSANTWWWTMILTWSLLVVLTVRWIWIQVDIQDRKLERDAVERDLLWEEWNDDRARKDFISRRPPEDDAEAFHLSEPNQPTRPAA